MLKRTFKQLLHISQNAVDAEDKYRPSIPPSDFLFFLHLPNEILFHIFSFLDVKALGRTGRVCVEFCEIHDDPTLWRCLLEKKYGKVGLVINKPVSPKRAQVRRKRRSGSFFVDANNNPMETPRAPSLPLFPTLSPNLSSDLPDTSPTPGEPSPLPPPVLPTPTPAPPLPAPAAPATPVLIMGDADEMDPVNYTSYVKKTIRTVHDVANSTDYEGWDFKEVVRSCVDYNSIAEAMKHLHSEHKCRILVREGTYRETIKIEVPVEIIGIGRMEKILVENNSTANLVTIDTKDSKQIKSFTVLKNLTLCQTGNKLEGGRSSPFFCMMLRSGDILVEKNILISESCSTVCVQHHKGVAILRGNSISGASAGVSIFKCRPDMTVDGNDIHDTGCAGIEIRPGTNPLIVRNKIHNSRSAGIFVFHNSSPISPFHVQGTIIRNDIFENDLSGVDISAGARPMLRHNNIRNGKSIGILIHDGGKGVIEKNEIHHNTKCNIFVQQSGAPIIRKNKIHSSGVGFSGIGEGAAGELVGNAIYNHESEGIGLLYKADPIVRNNKIFANKKAGVVVSHEGRGTFEGNEIYRNAGGGFNIQQREVPAMRDNHVHDNEAVPEDIKRCVMNNECTFSCTGYTFRPQTWFYCDTCAPQKDLGCCESCAKTCHEGHKLSEQKYSQFFCDCGAEWDCKLVKGDRRKAMLQSPVSVTATQSS
eukprot:Phypoly_transcript_01211.p1 GENE.Phypoly_transcript_01211~~Phypoly_transcript_01211.p1  ORF type:complete len:703 (-),score=108.91 Phypoly_transcript_01211:176-2284(-)